MGLEELAPDEMAFVRVNEGDVAVAMMERIGIRNKLAEARLKIQAKVPGVSDDELNALMEAVYLEAVSIFSYNIKLNQQGNIVNDSRGLSDLPGGNVLAHFGQMSPLNSPQTLAQQEGYIWAYTIAADAFKDLGLNQKAQGCLAIAGTKALKRDSYISSDSPSGNWKIH